MRRNQQTSEILLDSGDRLRVYGLCGQITDAIDRAMASSSPWVTVYLSVTSRDDRETNPKAQTVMAAKVHAESVQAVMNAGVVPLGWNVGVIPDPGEDYPDEE